MSTWIIALLGFYVIVTLGFFSAIQFERIKQEADFNVFQLIVAVGWPVWVVWYLWVLLDEWKRRRKQSAR